MKDYGDSRRIFLTNVATSRTMPHIQNRDKFPLKSITLRAINDILESFNENFTADIEGHDDIKNIPDNKCHFCL